MFNRVLGGLLLQAPDTGTGHKKEGGGALFFLGWILEKSVRKSFSFLIPIFLVSSCTYWLVFPLLAAVHFSLLGSAVSF